MGLVGRAVGLRGELEIEVLSDDPRRFAEGSRLLLAPALDVLTIVATRTHHGRTLVRFDQIPDRTTAESLRGRELVVPAAHVRELGADEFWDHELVGCVVVTASGLQVGRVTAVLHPPAQDLLELDGEDGILVPLVAPVIRSVDVPGGRIVIDPPPGLLDGSAGPDR